MSGGGAPGRMLSLLPMWRFGLFESACCSTWVWLVWSEDVFDWACRHESTREDSESTCCTIFQYIESTSDVNPKPITNNA